MKHKSIVLCFIVLVGPLFAKVSFGGLDVSKDSRMLFKASYRGQDTLFLAKLSDRSLQQLTVLPERLELLRNGRVVQVRNAFGCLRVPLGGGLPAPAKGWSSFVQDKQFKTGRPEAVVVSPDGNWILRIEPTSAGYGDLLMQDATSGERTLISSHVERSDDFAKWSLNSKLFIYEKSKELFYYPMNFEGLQEENYRNIGHGSIGSVTWGQENALFYAQDRTIYKVRDAELVFRSLYKDFLDIGEPVALLPFSFDKNFDEIYVSPNSDSLLLRKGFNALFFYPIHPNNTEILPYLKLSDSCYEIIVLWAPEQLTVISRNRTPEGGTTSLAYRLAMNEEFLFTPVSLPNYAKAVLSPDYTQILFWGQNGASIYDNETLKSIATVSNNPTYSCLWLGNNDFLIGDSQKLERVSVNGKALGRALICLSTLSVSAFELLSYDAAAGTKENIVVQCGDSYFVTDGTKPWAAAKAPVLREASQSSDLFRVYLSEQTGAFFTNLPMLRKISSDALTLPLFDANKMQAFASEQSLGLCFDLYEDDTGLSTVLNALESFGMKATFFLNGEFMRRHPSAVLDLVNAGHEPASMFFAPIDLETNKYKIDTNYVLRGLARNEDEFFNITGKELKLLWHAPFYRSVENFSMINTSSGYRTVKRDLDPLDADSDRIILASELVDRIIQMKRRNIVLPIRIGVPEGCKRSDYLFDRINVLLDALVNEGFIVRPISEL